MKTEIEKWREIRQIVNNIHKNLDLIEKQLSGKDIGNPFEELFRNMKN